jgi:hypothetical protein
MDIIADRHPYTPSVTRTPGASAQPRDETLDQGMAISIPGGVALSDTLDRGQVPHGVVLAVKPLADPPASSQSSGELDSGDDQQVGGDRSDVVDADRKERSASIGHAAGQPRSTGSASLTRTQGDPRGRTYRRLRVRSP